MKTRIIVCGGRDFTDKKKFSKYLDIILSRYENIEIVSGGAKGADSFSEEYAHEHGISITIFKANWSKYGKAAGPIRNKEMLKYALKEKPVIIAFWDGKSRGTKNMLKQAKLAGAVCHIVHYRDDDPGELTDEEKQKINEIVKIVLSGI